jgi:8-oxo-dGTP pyrophosphatase MutT (NUDIX family)
MWRPGPPAPWAGHPPSHIATARLVADVRARGSGRTAEAFPDARSSAVLIALFDGDDGAEVVLTRRAWHLSSHRGEVSFPGGRLDPGETPVDAALREAHEEVRLDPAAVEVVGELDHLATVVSRSLIVPVVARLATRPVLAPGTSEVDRILFVALTDLLRPHTFRDERWGTPPLDRAVYFFELDDETVWGATARMLVQLLMIATGTKGEVAGW